MAIMKVVQPASQRKRQSKNESRNAPVKTTTPHGSANKTQCFIKCRECVKSAIRFTILCFLVAHTTWDFFEVLVALFANYIINHPQGLDGFTLFESLQLIDITEFEHKKWENADLINLYVKTPRDEWMIETREELIKKCSTFDDKHVDNESYTTTDCNVAPYHIKQENYFCAIIEHPNRYHEAIKPLVSTWLVSSCFFLAGAPLVMFAFVWHSQCTRLLLLHIIYQLIPLSTYLSLLYNFYTSTRFELCGVNYMYSGLPYLRNFSTLVIVAKSVSKGVEIFFTMWFIYVISVEKEQKGFGVSVRQTYGSQVGPEHETAAVTFNDEVLQASRHYDDEDKPEMERVSRYNVTQNPTVKNEGRKSVVKHDANYGSTKRKIGSEVEISKDDYIPD